jgi:hypothetical protein
VKTLGLSFRASAKFLIEITELKVMVQIKIILCIWRAQAQKNKKDLPSIINVLCFISYAQREEHSNDTSLSMHLQNFSM